MKENTKCRTDSNGREFIYRPFSRKPTGYPISTQVQITDGIKQMTLLSDRGQYADCSKPGLLMLNVRAIINHCYDNFMIIIYKFVSSYTVG